MRRAIRRVVAFIVRLADKYACETYDDVAELSRGPCRRCIGKVLSTPTISP